MNTLSRASTARFFPSVDSYNAFRKHWSVLINSERKHGLSAAHHLLYLALRGKDWRKGFTPPTNRLKLDNGAFEGWMMFRALDLLQNKYREQELLAPFDGLVTPQTLHDLQRLLPSARPFTFKRDDFANGSYPFEAYKNPETGYAIMKIEGSSNE